MKVKQWSERSQRFTFNSCDLKQRSERSQRFHLDGSEVRQHSEGSQRFYFWITWDCFLVACITTAIVNVIWYLHLVVVSWDSILILVLDLIFLWFMWKPDSDGSLISQFNSNIQKQRNNSSLTCCFLYRMKLNLRSNRSEYFSLKSTETYISTDNFRPRISVSDWLIFCSGNLMLHLKKNWK